MSTNKTKSKDTKLFKFTKEEELRINAAKKAAAKFMYEHHPSKIERREKTPQKDVEKFAINPYIFKDVRTVGIRIYLKEHNYEIDGIKITPPKENRIIDAERIAKIHGLKIAL